MEIYEGIEIVYAETMDDVLKTALVRMPEKPVAETAEASADVQ